MSEPSASAVARGAQRRALVKALKQRKKQAAESGDEGAAKRAERALEGLARRKCRRDVDLFGVPPCTKTFVPVIAGSRTQHYCSEECAMLALAHREGWVPDKLVAQIAERSQASKDRLQRIRGERAGKITLAGEKSRQGDAGEAEATPAPAPRATRAPDSSVDARKGPWRAVAQMLREAVSATTGFARMECGHEIAVPRGAARYRCRKCR